MTDPAAIKGWWDFLETIPVSPIYLPAADSEPETDPEEKDPREDPEEYQPHGDDSEDDKKEAPEHVQDPDTGVIDEEKLVSTPPPPFPLGRRSYTSCTGLDSRWDTLGEPSGKYDYYVRYDPPPETTPIEEIVATGWETDDEETVDSADSYRP